MELVGDEEVLDAVADKAETRADDEKGPKG